LFCFFHLRQAIIALIPAFILVGLAWNLVMLYVGLALYAFGKCTAFNQENSLLQTQGVVLNGQ